MCEEFFASLPNAAVLIGSNELRLQLLSLTPNFQMGVFNSFPPTSISNPHSCRRASTGCMFAARNAGYRPNTTPTKAEIEKASKGDQSVIIVFIPAAWLTMKGIVIPNSTPRMPPAAESKTVSTRNWEIMSCRRAPRARPASSQDARSSRSHEPARPNHSISLSSRKPRPAPAISPFPW